MRGCRLASLLVAIFVAWAPVTATAHGHGGGHHGSFFHSYGSFGFGVAPFGSALFRPSLGLHPFQPTYGLFGPPPGVLGVGSAPMLRPAPPDERRILESESGIEQQIRGLEQAPSVSGGNPAQPPAPTSADKDWKPL